MIKLLIDRLLGWLGIEKKGHSIDETDGDAISSRPDETPSPSVLEVLPPRKSHPPSRKPSTAADKPLPVPATPPQPEWHVAMFDVPAEPGKTRFHDLDLPTSIMHGIFDLGFQYCTAIQAEILPKALTGQDVIGQAQTGTGKSAAFLIAIFTQLLNSHSTTKRPKGAPLALILSPTRELALQIEKDAVAIGKYTPIRIVSVFGGMGYDKQKRDLRSNVVDIVVATPGRLIDFKHQQIVKLNMVEYLVIDEADRMLDMGFIPDIRKIVLSTPPKAKRQTMFFSATLNEDVNRLAGQWTKDSFGVEIEPDQIASESINQIVYLVTSDEKYPLLYNLITKSNLERVIIFTNRRDQARKLADLLVGNNLSAALISGDLHQNKRIKALENFRSGAIRVLVATDVAARGLHIDNISHVINFNFPQDPEHYIHRIGRTGRAGATGTSVSFACEDDSFYIPAIEKVLGSELKCEYPDADLLEPPPPPESLPKANPRPKPKSKHRSNTKNRRPAPKKSASGGKADNKDAGRKSSGGNRNRRRRPRKKRAPAPQGETPKT